jgi:Flp pilus assembly protein TadB
MKIKKNVGKKDQTVRYVIAVLLAALVAVGVVKGTLASIALVVSLVMAMTGYFRFCALYTLLGQSTCCGSCQADDKKDDA